MICLSHLNFLLSPGAIMDFSKHGKQRLQQRCISPQALEWLERFGSIETQINSEMIFFDKKSLKKIRQYTGGFSDKYDGLEKIYMVRDANGKVITVGYRDKHIKRNERKYH